MFYRFLLTVLVLLLPLLGFSQSSNWLSTIDLDVSVSSSDRIDLYTDKDGNHIIVQKSNQLVYYLFSATGSQVRTSTRDNNVSESPRLSRIVGREGKLYIIYKEGDKIKTQRSTDAGANWSTTAVNEITLDNSTSNGIDAWTDANGVHLVYSEYDDSNENYITWYQRNPFDQQNWVDEKQVTDLSGDAGGFPSVTTSANRVHVAFTDNNDLYPGGISGNPKTRDRASGTWQSSYQLENDDIPQCFLIANSSKLHAFYYVEDVPVHNLKYENRSLSGTTWNSTVTLLETNANAFEPLDMAVTADDQVHIFYHDGEGRYNVWNSTTNWGSEYSPNATDEVTSQRIAANSNDIYVVWNNESTIKLRQRDFGLCSPCPGQFNPLYCQPSQQ
jgi:hypothetical protein